MQKKEESFWQQLQKQPEAIRRRFMKHCFGGSIVAILSVVFMIYFMAWQYAVGLLIALYIIYIGLRIVWDYANEKLVCKRMVCIQASRVLRNKEQLYLIMKEIDATAGDESKIHKFFLSVSKRESKMLTPNVVINAYIRPDNPRELVVWEIVDYLH